MSLNCLTDFPYDKHYYLTHPWLLFKHLWQNLCDAWSRATKGYCMTDVWNIDDWFLELLPEMLRALADKGYSYPCNDEFPTYESWQDWLHSVADAFEGCTQDFTDSKNEYHDEYFNTLMNNRIVQKKSAGTIVSFDDNEELHDITELYRLREKELWDEREALLKDTFNEFVKHFNSLWD